MDYEHSYTCFSRTRPPSTAPNETSSSSRDRPPPLRSSNEQCLRQYINAPREALAIQYDLLLIHRCPPCYEQCRKKCSSSNGRTPARSNATFVMSALNALRSKKPTSPLTVRAPQKPRSSPLSAAAFLACYIQLGVCMIHHHSPRSYRLEKQGISTGPAPRSHVRRPTNNLSRHS